MKKIALICFLLVVVSFFAGCSHHMDQEEKTTPTMTDKEFDEHHGHDMEEKKQQEASTGLVSTIELLQPAVAVSLSTGMVFYTSGTAGYLAQPVSGDTLPGLVIIHERRGLNQHIKEMADVIAMQGYRVLAVDLYKGTVAADMEQAKILSSSLKQEEATANLLDAERFLRKTSTKVASWGWCLGGKQSLELSMASDTLDATVVYYGRLPTETEKIKTIDGPLLGIFAELDTGIPPASVDAFEAVLQEQGKKDYSISIYSGVNHAFANPTGKAFAKDATLDAWKKTLEFLKQVLQ